MKNITPANNNTAPVKKPDFVRIFLYALIAYLVALIWFKPPQKEEKAVRQDFPVVVESPRNMVPFETANIKGEFNASGIRFDTASLKKYRQTADKDSANVQMLSYNDAADSSYAEFGFLPFDRMVQGLPNAETKWSVVEKSSDSIKLSYKNPQGVIFARKMNLDDGYMLTVEDNIHNGGNLPTRFFPYARLTAKDNGTKASSHIGFAGYLNGSLEELTFRDIEKKKVEEFSSTGGWFGFVDNYFMDTIILPNGKSSVRAVYPDATTLLPEQKKAFQADFIGEKVVLDPGQTTTLTNRLYLGPKDSTLLNKYSAKYDIPKFDLAIDYGFFYILAKPFAMLLRWLHEFSGNFGAAIILFTIVMRILLFPIAQKSFRSMERIKKLTPEIKRIQTVYANDKPRMNLEIAMLYKREKVNPASGCLPLLLQLPIFIALYKAIITSIEMRHAPFIGWIQDLSSPDPTSVFNLFGLLPYAPWNWLPALGILPIIMGLTMWVQQKLQPSMGDQAQMAVMKWLPVLFTVMFAGLPSGLVLYWTVNNLLGILQQRFIR